MPVHFGGLACDMDAVTSFAEKHGLMIIEDAAHALPSSHDNRLIGSWNTQACVFSFYANKPITTGEGGMVVTRDPIIADRVRKMRTHGLNRDAFDRFTKVSASWAYDVVAPGFKYNLTDMAAAIGVQQLARAHELQSARQNIADQYFEALGDLPLECPAPPQTGNLHSWHLFPICLSDEAPLTRDELITALSDRNIGTSVHYRPLHQMTYWKEHYPSQPGEFSVADRYFAGAVSLPLFPSMTQEQVDHVVNVLHQASGVSFMQAPEASGEQVRPSRLTLVLKRSFDITVSAAAILALLPLFGVVALAIKLDSPGPVFFRQARVGRGGTSFRIFKFRSMCSDAAKKGASLTVKADPRVTRVGDFLRNHKIDELPQLFNVLAGSMSFVGPRPEVSEYMEFYTPRQQAIILSMRPGITDYAAIVFRDESVLLDGSTDPIEVYRTKIMPIKFALYERYSREISLTRDIQLILATLMLLVSSKVPGWFGFERDLAIVQPPAGRTE